MAATTTSAPRARAASSTSMGNLPLPAMRPIFYININPAKFNPSTQRAAERGPTHPIVYKDHLQRRLWALIPLLDDSPRGAFDETQQQVHILAKLAFGFELFQSLRGVEFGGQQQLEG